MGHDAVTVIPLHVQLYLTTQSLIVLRTTTTSPDVFYSLIILCGYAVLSHKSTIWHGTGLVSGRKLLSELMLFLTRVTLFGVELPTVITESETVILCY